jgi:membrane-bound lytic murein transglycosylase D
MLRVILLAFTSFTILTGCQTAPVEVTGTAEPPPQHSPVAARPAETAPPPATAVTVAEDDIWVRIGSELTWQTLDNDAIRRERDAFLRQSNYLPTVSNRAGHYLYYIVQSVEARQLPPEIALLPLVESTLDPFAVSSSSAAGLWQIMPATGRHLGLEQNWWYDGRRDLRASTRAALDYLEHLHDEFDGDWLLALAAYNSGKGRVKRAIRRNARNGLATDYWSLRLPRETRGYVPKLIALTQIVAEPERFDVRIPPVANAPAFEVAVTGGQLEMVRAAELAGIDLSTLRALNPGQLRWATSPEGAQELLLPVGSAARFNRGVASLSEDDRVQWQHYRIERGDSLIRIARKFDTEVGLLREVNNIRGSRIRAGDTMLIPHGDAWESSLALARGTQAERRGYRVRRGDSLYLIAGRFNVSINDIIAWNALDPNAYLQPGQRLTLYVRGG